MARTIDDVIDYVRHFDRLPPVMKQVVINRLDPEPTEEEIERAARQVYPDAIGDS